MLRAGWTNASSESREVVIAAGGLSAEDNGRFDLSVELAPP